MSTKPKQEKGKKKGKGVANAKGVSITPKMEARVKAIAAAARAPGMVKAQNSVANRVVRSIMNPSSGGMRLATINDCNPTSLVDLHAIVPVNTTTFAGNYTAIKAGVSYQALFRDPLRSMVYLKANCAPFTYVATFPGAGDFWYADNLDGVMAGRDNPIVPLYMRHLSGPAPHGPVLFCGTDEGKQGYLWMDGGANSTVLVRVKVSNACVVGIRAFVGRPSGEVAAGYANLSTLAGAVAEYTFAATADNYLANGGYVRFSFTPSAFCMCDVELRLITVGNLDCMAHVAPAGVHLHLPQLAQARLNAVSMLLSNGAASMYNDGFIQAINMGPETPWNDLLPLEDLSGLAADVNFFAGIFKKGMYTFLKPSDSEDVDFFPYAKMGANGSTVAECAFPLYRSRYVLSRVASNAYGSPPTYPGLEFLLNLSMVIEFQTNDMWFDAEIPQESCLEVDRARDILRRIPNFYENSSHLAGLANAARNAGGFLRKHAGKIGGALSLLFPKFSPVFSALAGAL